MVSSTVKRTFNYLGSPCQGVSSSDKIKREPEEAATLFRRACDLGLQAGCEALARQQAGLVPWQADKKQP